MALIYKRFDRVSGELTDLSYAQALDIVLACYKDNDMSRDMLTIENHIITPYSIIGVLDTETPNFTRSLNLLPDGVEYDDDGMRIEEGH